MSEDAEIQKTMEMMLKQTKCGASVWTTFRWMGNLLYLACWLIALPVELLLNRRMGRRYTGFLPLIGAFAFFLAWMTVGAGVFQKAAEPSKIWVFGPLPIMLIMAAAVICNRAANWWRFQSDEQVHSFSNGVPVYLFPPTTLTARLAKKAGTIEPSDLNWRKQVSAIKDGSAGSMTFATGIARYFWNQLLGFGREWRSGGMPTGPIMWIACTMVHPALLMVGAGLLFGLNAAVASYLMLAGTAIFLKARIQKAMISETIYDLFDARIEQKFVQSLSDPKRLEPVESAGFVASRFAHSSI